MEKHLKPDLYYSDLYDRHTVDECRRTEQLFDRDDGSKLPKTKGVSKKEAERIRSVAKQWYLRFQVGERYLNKDKTIREWMDADRKKDELYESAEAPAGIRCLTCRNLMKPNFKHLWSDLEKPDRMLFMYDCPNKCMPRRAFFSDSEEWRVKPHLCPRCGVPLRQEESDDGKKCVTTRTCPKCEHVETEEYTWSVKKEEEIDEKFPADRDRFCMTTEEGSKFWAEKHNLEQLAKLGKEFKEQEDSWQEKLKQNPKGFILDGIGRTCAICRNPSREDGSWYDKWGIKCLVCQKAIDEGEIPPSLAKEEDSWYRKFDLEHYFNLTPPAIRKWIKEGILKARTVSYYGKGVHVELFLLKDNKGFLPPKKLLKSHSVSEVKDGKTWTHMEPWYRFVDPFKHLAGYKIMDYMRLVPAEEMKAREEEKKRKWEEKQKIREARKKTKTRGK